MNDVFAIINAVPAISLMAYGFFNKGLVPGLCFGAVSLLDPSKACDPVVLSWARSNCVWLPTEPPVVYLIVRVSWKELTLEVLVFFAGSWDHNVWYGVHVCPRWTGTPKVSCRAYCWRSLPPKGCSCTSGTSFNSLNFCFVLISYVQLSTWLFWFHTSTYCS